jgi:predicted Zn-dependent peptidase
MDILGGNDSLMFTRLRDDLGFVYSTWFYQTYRWQAGMLVGYIGCKGDSTGQAIRESVKIITALQNNVPKKELKQKRSDALNSFVFNVDTPAELVEVYGRYYMRKEPLDTLSRIQDAFMTASREELEILARKFLDPKKLQVFVVGDMETRVKDVDGTEVTLENEMETVAKTLGMPYKKIELR